MSLVADNLRSEAKGQREAAAVLLNSDDLNTDRKKQIAATVALTSANVFNALADLMDFLRVSASSDPLMAKRQQFIERSDAIRKAAADALATGNWGAFDRLTGTGERLEPGVPATGSGTGRDNSGKAACQSAHSRGCRMP